MGKKDKYNALFTKYSERESFEFYAKKVGKKNAGYYVLAERILQRAIRDYVSAILKQDKAQMHSCERFFLSDYGQGISLHNGEAIIYHAKQIAAEKLRAERDKTSRKNQK